MNEIMGERIGAATEPVGRNLVGNITELILDTKYGERLILIGPARAKKILEQFYFEGQRNVFPYQVKMLANMMQGGEWLDGDQVTFCSLPDGRVFLVNGYHRMHAVIAANAEIIFQIRVIDCKTMIDVRKVYITFDTSTRKRSDAEVIGAMGISDEYGLTKQMSSAIYRAAPLFANKMKYLNYQTSPIQVRNVTHRIMIAEDLWAIGKKYQDLISTAAYKHRGRMLMPGIAGVAFATIKYQPEIAALFWPRVGDMVGLEANDPRMLLARALSERSYAPSVKDGQVPNTAIDASLAWNAFYENRMLSVLKTTAVKTFSVKGTTWR